MAFMPGKVYDPSFWNDHLVPKPQDGQIYEFTFVIHHDLDVEIVAPAKGSFPGCSFNRKKDDFLSDLFLYSIITTKRPCAIVGFKVIKGSRLQSLYEYQDF